MKRPISDSSFPGVSCTHRMLLEDPPPPLLIDPELGRLVEGLDTLGLVFELGLVL